MCLTNDTHRHTFSRYIYIERERKKERKRVRQRDREREANEQTMLVGYLVIYIKVTTSRLIYLFIYFVCKHQSVYISLSLYLSEFYRLSIYLSIYLCSRENINTYTHEHTNTYKYYIYIYIYIQDIKFSLKLGGFWPQLEECLTTLKSCDSTKQSVFGWLYIYICIYTLMVRISVI